MKHDKQEDGSGKYLGWTSPFTIVFVWHALFDGTWLCRCPHSREYKQLRKRNLERTPPL